MKYRILQPITALKNIISHFLVATWDPGSDNTPSAYYVVANSLTNFTFAFESAGVSSELLFSWVEGHTFQPRALPVSKFFHLLGVSIFPHAIPRLFNIPSGCLSNEIIPIDTFLGADGITLNYQIAEAGSTGQRIRILSDFFLKKADDRTEDKLMVNAMEKIKRFDGRTKIMDMAKEFNLSQRQFSRRFKDLIGFSPKTYARIVRFESIINSYSDSPSLTDLSYDKGYFDQAHLNHEFRSLSGFAPTDFWKLSDPVD